MLLYWNMPNVLPFIKIVLTLGSENLHHKLLMNLNTPRQLGVCA